MYRHLNVLIAVICMLLGAAPASAESEAEKSVLVTGASSGIGLEITMHLARHGYFVYAGARKDADLKRLDSLHNVQSVRLDVTKQDEIDAVVALIADQGRGLYGVINNAGVASVGLLSDVSDDDVAWMHEINVMGPLRINRAFLPLLRESHGRTATIGSLSSFVSSPSSGAYSMSKIAIEAYTEVLAAELSDDGVQVGIIDPGAYQSRGREKVAMQMLTGSPDLDQELDAEQQAVLDSVRAANAGLKKPDEVAEAVRQFLSSEMPPMRYMVAPDRDTADLVIRSVLARAVQLNADQPYELDREELIELLDELLDAHSKH